ncbi:MAG: UDP-N-acetylmuramyl peptide synthase [Legionella sp.]|nr:UDP-N-acetylmuramyl peptide synthase [Legionella sp.]
MDRNIKIYYQSAKALGFPVTYLSDVDSLKIHLGGKNYYFNRTVTPFNCGASIYLSKNKHLLNKLLEQSGFPVPKAIVINKENFEKFPLADLIVTLDFPVVIKPAINTSRGKDVLCNIKNSQRLNNYLQQRFTTYSSLQIEEFHQGLKEYRVLICKNKVLGVVERFGAHVIGDGKHTIKELVELSNDKRLILSDSLSISPLVFDDEYENCLEEQGLSIHSIPDEGQNVRLCYTANTGRGGDINSLGKKINPYNAWQLVKAAQVTGLNVVGFDVLCEDISQSFEHKKWLIIEANFHPDITIHEIPNNGEKTDVTKKILRQLIVRHPFSYLYGLLKNNRFGLYIKVTFIFFAIWAFRFALEPGFS